MTCVAKVDYSPGQLPGRWNVRVAGSSGSPNAPMSRPASATESAPPLSLLTVTGGVDLQGLHLADDQIALEDQVALTVAAPRTEVPASTAVSVVRTGGATGSTGACP